MPERSSTAASAGSPAGTEDSPREEQSASTSPPDPEEHAHRSGPHEGDDEDDVGDANCESSRRRIANRSHISRPLIHSSSSFASVAWRWFCLHRQLFCGVSNTFAASHARARINTVEGFCREKHLFSGQTCVGVGALN